MPYNVLDEHISTAASHPFKTHKEAGRESWFSAHQPAQKLASALTSLFSETASSLSADYSAHSGCPLGQHSRAKERKKESSPARRLLSVMLRSSSNTILQKKKKTAAHLELQCQSGGHGAVRSSAAQGTGGRGESELGEGRTGTGTALAREWPALRDSKLQSYILADGEDET